MVTTVSTRNKKTYKDIYTDW